MNVTIDELNEATNSISDGPVARIAALIDRGSQLNVIRADLVESLAVPKIGSVSLRGIFGAPVMAALVKLHVSLVDGSTVNKTMPVTFAVCDGLNEEMILTAAFVNQLQCVSRSSTVCTVQSNVISGNVDCSDTVNAVENVIGLSSNDVQAAQSADEGNDLENKPNATAQSFLKEQQNDETLTG